MTAQLSQSATTADETFDLTHPVTGELVGTFPVHTAEDVARAVAKAREAQQWWADLGFGGRRKRIAALDLVDRASTATRSATSGFRETGKPRGDVQFELLAGLEDLRWAAAARERVLGERRVAPGMAMVNFDARLSLRAARRRRRDRAVELPDLHRRTAGWPTRWPPATPSSSSRASSARRPASTRPSRSTRPTRTRPRAWSAGSPDSARPAPRCARPASTRSRSPAPCRPGGG